MRILNLHGFNGKGDNTNCHTIKKFIPVAEVISETTDYKDLSPKTGI